jgi:nucleotide-binding universal stress UspA family protein
MHNFATEETNVIAGFRRILTAVDGSENAVRAARVAVTLAKNFGSELIVCQVIPTPLYLFSQAGWASLGLALLSDNSSARKEAKALLDEIVRLAETESVKTSELIIENTFSVAKAIVSNAATRNVDLIVIGTRGQTGFKKLLMGSVSSGVLGHADCSVLVVR